MVLVSVGRHKGIQSLGHYTNGRGKCHRGGLTNIAFGSLLCDKRSHISLCLEIHTGPLDVSTATCRGCHPSALAASFKKEPIKSVRVALATGSGPIRLGGGGGFPRAKKTSRSGAPREPNGIVGNCTGGSPILLGCEESPRSCRCPPGCHNNGCDRVCMRASEKAAWEETGAAH